jgi:glycosyltransferase involved in cell wall biosynthesis
VNIGALEPRKNQNYLLDIAAAAKHLGTPLSLTLIGDGPDRSKLQERARSLSINDIVNFKGEIPQAVGLFGDFRACVHASRIENLPISLIEALSMSKPIFAAAVGGVPEIFHDGIEGRYIPLNDAGRAAQCIVEWMKSPGQLALAAQAARRRFAEHFATRKVAPKLSDFLSDIAHL